MNSWLDMPLLRAVSTTFSELGFLLAEAEPTAVQAAAAEMDGAAIVDFEGLLSGRLMVRLYGGVLPALTANMLGQDERPSLALQRDALGEVANVICGNVLPSLAGTGAVFRLGAPRSVGAAVPGLAPTLRTVVGLEAGRAEVDLFVVDAEAAGAAWP